VHDVESGQRPASSWDAVRRLLRVLGNFAQTRKVATNAVGDINSIAFLKVNGSLAQAHGYVDPCSQMFFSSEAASKQVSEEDFKGFV
jgi:hypothetical protein